MINAGHSTRDCDWASVPATGQPHSCHPSARKPGQDRSKQSRNPCELSLHFPLPSLLQQLPCQQPLNAMSPIMVLAGGRTSRSIVRKTRLTKLGITSGTRAVMPPQGTTMVRNTPGGGRTERPTTRRATAKQLGTGVRTLAGIATNTMGGTEVVAPMRPLRSVDGSVSCPSRCPLPSSERARLQEHPSAP